MAAHIKIKADVTGDLLFYPAAVRTLGSSVIRITIHYNILNAPPPPEPTSSQLGTRVTHAWYVSEKKKKRGTTSITLCKVACWLLT